MSDVQVAPATAPDNDRPQSVESRLAHLEARMDYLATKEDLQVLRGEMYNGFHALRAETQTLRSDMQTSIQTLRSDMQTSIQTLRSDMQTSIQTLRSDMQTSMQTLRSDMREDLHTLKFEMIRIMAWSIGGLLTGLSAIAGLAIGLFRFL